MNTDSLIKFFEEKLKEVEKMISLSRNNIEFKVWKNSIVDTYERMGESYTKHIKEISLSSKSGVVIPECDPDYNSRDREKYIQIIKTIETEIRSTIKSLEKWGYQQTHTRPDDSKDNRVTINNINQQTQNNLQTINLSQYDQQTQNKIQELYDELGKKKQNKETIRGILKWLADKGIDALIAILSSKI